MKYSPTETPDRFEDFEESFMSVETLNRFRSLESHNFDLMIAFVEAFDEIFLNMTQSQGQS